jgi:signal transduction histidine kinase
MATAFGTTPAELAGSQLSTFLPEAVATGRLEEVRRALSVGGAVTFQDSIGMRHFHNIAVPMAAAGGGETVQLVTREMTLQKRSEQKLERKSEELMLINRLVRHDINNDVQLLVGWADLLDEHVDDEGAELVDRIERRSGHIAELTAIARDFVDSLEGDREVSLEPVRLDRVLEAEVEKGRSDAPDATFRVRGETEAVVRANELLSSVIGNLLSNAVRHNDTERPTVEVAVHTEGPTVVLRVADDGAGVPDDRKEEIFGKGTMGPDSPGSGVGLYLVRRLVEQYGGTIRVEDNEPRGAAFVVELQRHGDATAGVEAARSAQGGNAPRR